MSSPSAEHSPAALSYDTLHDDLLLLSGKVGANGIYGSPGEHYGGNPYQLSFNEVSKYLDIAHGWLPHKIEQLGGTTDDIQEPEGSYRINTSEGERTITYDAVQLYGHAPAATLFANTPVLEVGGPTTGARSMEAMYGIRPTLVTNVVDKPGQLGYSGEVDEIADATNLPYADESFGAVFASCLPGLARDRDPEIPDLHSKALQEAKRVLATNGRLFWNGGSQADFDELLQLGFQLEGAAVYTATEESLETGNFTVPQLLFNGVFIKK